MLNVRQGRHIACALVFFVGISAAQPIEADETNLPSVPPTKSAASAMDEHSIAAKAQTRPIVIALAEPAPATVQPKSAAPTQVPPATAVWAAPARFFTINEVLAKRKQLGSKAPAVQLAAVNSVGNVSDLPATTAPPMRGDEPFGLFTFRAPEGLLWTKWRKVEADIQAEAPALARCRNQPEHCTAAEARFVSIVKDAKARQGRARLELVNRRVNETIRYTSDIVQWSAPDVWSAPLDVNNKGSFNTGIGDCEDYAIAKYVALREAGVSAGDLRLLLVRDRPVGLDHAVLAARQDGHWLILDNRWARLIDDTDAKQFLPLFALNDDGVKLFAAPYAEKRTTPTDAVSLNDQDIAAGDASIAAPLPSVPIGIGTLPLVM
jgi:predicted transglutaminase-like cysteine proteinase